MPPSPQQRREPGAGLEYELNQDGHERAPTPLPSLEDGAKQKQQAVLPPLQEEDQPAPGNEIQKAPAPHPLAQAVEENARQQDAPPPLQEENRPGPNNENQNKIEKRVSFDEALLDHLEKEAAKRKFEKTLWEAAVEREAALFCQYGPRRLLGKRFLEMSWNQKIRAIATLFVFFAMGCGLYMLDLVCALLVPERQKKEAAAAKNEENHAEHEI